VICLTRSQPVALLGEAPPRVLVAPPATRGNSWEDVADLSASFGITLDGWQELVLQAAMGERTDGTWAARRVGLSVPRQNGKSQLLVARALAGALLFGERKIVISAHQQDTARESFSKLMEIIEDERNATLRARIKPNGIMQALNREAVKFTNGATIQFKARSGAGARGFSSDCLMLDEAQILSQRAWVSINSTMSAMPNPQIWLLGTPPTPEDDGDVFGSVRSSAMAGQSTASAWCEWAADPEADPALEATRWSANPAWNLRINHEVVDGEFETYPVDRFSLDRLGIWATDSRATRMISVEDWTATGIHEAPTEGIKSFGVAFSFDGTRVALAGAMKHETGIHAELVGLHSGDATSGIAPLADWLAERWRDTATIVISGKAGAGVLASALLDRGVPKRIVQVAATSDYCTACAMVIDGLRDRSLTHLATEGQAALDASVAVSDKKARGLDGAWGWHATTAAGDETPIEALSLAHWGARTSKRRPGHKTRGRVMA
jgi:hypothetical protein